MVISNLNKNSRKSTFFLVLFKSINTKYGVQKSVEFINLFGGKKWLKISLNLSNH